MGYIREKGEKQLNRLAEISEERRKIEGWLMGGDFNARTGEKREIEDEKEERKKKSKDTKVNKEGEMLLSWLEEEGWGIMNGVKEGDKEGKWTFTGSRGESVIDYVIG